MHFPESITNVFVHRIRIVHAGMDDVRRRISLSPLQNLTTVREASDIAETENCINFDLNNRIKIAPSKLEAIMFMPASPTQRSSRPKATCLNYSFRFLIPK